MKGDAARIELSMSSGALSHAPPGLIMSALTDEDLKIVLERVVAAGLFDLLQLAATCKRLHHFLDDLPAPVLFRLLGRNTVPLRVSFPVALGRDPALTDVQPEGAAGLMQLSRHACTLAVKQISPALKILMSNFSMHGLVVCKAKATPWTLNQHMHICLRAGARFALDATEVAETAYKIGLLSRRGLLFQMLPQLLDDESDGVDDTSDETDPLTHVLSVVPTFAELVSGHCDLLTLSRLTLVSRGFHEGFQVVLEDRWLEALMEIDGSCTDPVGKHACVPGFPICGFTTTNNLPKSCAIVSHLLPSRLHHRIDDVVRAWGVNNILKTKLQESSVELVRMESAVEIERVITKQQLHPKKRLNMLVEGCVWDQLLQNGGRPELMLSGMATPSYWDALGVHHAVQGDTKRVMVRSAMLDETSDGSHVRFATIVSGAMPKPAVANPVCKHNPLCIRASSHHQRTCVPARDAMDGGANVGEIGFACIVHMSASKTLGLSKAHLNKSSALVIRRLLLGITMLDQISFYI